MDKVVRWTHGGQRLVIRSPQFPLLDDHNHRVTSRRTDAYNCIAWAACDSERFWWPGPGTPSYWPAGVEAVASVDAFRAAFETLGYAECESPELEDEVQKIAIYVSLDGVPTHAARQLVDGGWTSKLGRFVDIRHATPGAICGPAYGEVRMYMARPRQEDDPLPPH